MAGKHVVIVPGYGVNPTPELRTYCEKIRWFIESHYVDLLILSGGESFHCTKPGLTEARVLWKLISGEKGLRHTPHVIFEEEALTSIGNIENAAKHMHGWLQASSSPADATTVTVFCEEFRFKKIETFVVAFLPEYKLENIRIYPVSFGGGMASMAKQAVSTIIETRALSRPQLREWLENRALHNATWR